MMMIHSLHFEHFICVVLILFGYHLWMKMKKKNMSHKTMDVLLFKNNFYHKNIGIRSLEKNLLSASLQINFYTFSSNPLFVLNQILVVFISKFCIYGIWMKNRHLTQSYRHTCQSCHGRNLSPQVTFIWNE